MPFWDRRQPGPADEEAIARFLAALPRDTASQVFNAWDDSATKKLLGVDDPTFTAVVARYAGTTLGGGLLRFLPIEGDMGLTEWNLRNGWRADWPSIPTAVAFATDWRGNLYAFDSSRTPAGERRVAWLRIATGEYECPDMSFREFIAGVVPQLRSQLFDEPLFASWIEAGGSIPTPDQCVGHTVPLVLGGTDDAANLEPLSLRVWVSLAGQIHEQTRKLPPGTKITGFRVAE
jgi:hypothetical protein